MKGEDIVFRDFIYLDIDRVQSIIAQLQEGLLNEVMEGKTEQTTGGAQMSVNLLAMSNLLDQVIEYVNTFQEFIGSVSYPDVAVSPIAVYREISPGAVT